MRQILSFCNLNVLHDTLYFSSIQLLLEYKSICIDLPLSDFTLKTQVDELIKLLANHIQDIYVVFCDLSKYYKN